MITLTPVVYAYARSDKKYSVKIRVTKERKSSYVDSGFVVTDADLTRKGKIKTESVITDCKTIIKRWQGWCNGERDAVVQMSAKELGRWLDGKEQERKAASPLDMFAFWQAHIDNLGKQPGKDTTARDYRAVLNTLKRYTGRDELSVQDISVRWLKDFEAWIPRNPANKDEKRKMARAVTKCMELLRAIHNEMKRVYNDEDNGVILIPGSPFSRYKIPTRPATRKQALDADMIRKVFALPEKESKKRRQRAHRWNAALAAFKLSFLLIGMNTADMYELSSKQVDGDKITYKRKKTRTRRADEAEIQVWIQEQAKPLMADNADDTGKRVFWFANHYANEANFNKAVNVGLKEIARDERIKLPDLKFYAARHSWATIAVNDCGIDKQIVHEALNHSSDAAMKVTDIYVRKSWSPINDANRKVIEFCFAVTKK